jgi:integrase-like protein
MMDGAVQICRGFTVVQWKKLNGRLVNAKGGNTNDEQAWHCAIEVFERRIRERFLSCIEALERADSKSDAVIPDVAPADCSTLPVETEAVVPGFSIIALCCLLAETLQSFRCKTHPSKSIGRQLLDRFLPCVRVPQTTTVDAFKAFLRRPAFRGAFVEEQIEAIAANAGLPAEKQHPHALKHSIASHLVSANVNLALVKQQLGHKSIGSTMRYVSGSDQQASKATTSALMQIY